MLPNKEGQRVPDVTFKTRQGEDWVDVTTSDLFDGKKVVVFSLPGAYTPTCSSTHLPRFNELAATFKANGIDDVVCMSVNDPFVMDAWGKATGASAAGITMLGDAVGSFTRAIGMAFDWPPDGFYGRSRRYSMLVEDGTLTRFFPEDKPGCNISAGEHMLAEI